MSHKHLLDNQYQILRMDSDLSSEKGNASKPSSASSLASMLKSLTLAEHLLTRNVHLNDTAPNAEQHKDATTAAVKTFKK